MGVVKFMGPAARAALLLLGTTLLLFPNIPRFAHHLARLADPESLIEPDHPAVAALSHNIDRAIPPGLSRPDQVRWIESFVEKRLAYTHDWTQWWNVDYWPTASEALEAGREDCDGIAVVTASVLRHRGFHARLVGNTMHIWVAVDDTGQEILGAQEDKAFASDTGWTLPRLDTLLRGTRFGLVEFPAARWAMVVAWVLGILAWGSRRRVVESLGAGLIALALAIAAATLLDGAPFAVALAAILAALAAAQIAIRRRRRPAALPAAPSA
jgi:hypothetical protein